MKAVLLFTIFLYLRVECAKILGVFPGPSYSQFILTEVLMTEIAKKGHQVTVICPFEPKNEIPNYRTIKTDRPIRKDSNFDLFKMESAGLFKNILVTYQLGNMVTQQTLNNSKVQELLHSNESFDLVILEQFFNDAMKGFATHFKAPLVLFSSMGLTEWNKHFMGNPILPSINAVSYTEYTNHMKFFQRFRNLVGAVFDYLYRNFVFYPIQRKYLQEYFSSPMDFDQIINNASLMLLNSHVTTSENALLPYNVIEIGGFHVVQNPLSKDLQEYLDSAKDGAILFSLGSNLKSANLSNDTLNAIFRVFGKLKQKILWKFEKPLPNQPENVFISKWLSQSDILAHPNVQLFITHGGMLSTIEAIFHGVPMVGIPILADQKMNMARARSHEIANLISFSELSEETLFSAINETTNDPKFHANARKMSNLMRDRVVRPTDLAIYWIEYIIRHKGMQFQAPALKLYWFEVYMVDILGFILFNILMLYVLIKCVFSFIQKKRCNKMQSKNVPKKNKKKQQ